MAETKPKKQGRRPPDPNARTKQPPSDRNRVKRHKRLKARKNFREQLIRIVYGPHPEDVAEMSGITAERRAQLALRQDVLFDWAGGKDVGEIANDRNLKEGLVKRLLGDAAGALHDRYSQAEPRDNFAYFAAFNLGIIRKLEQLYEEFMGDKENRQYSAAVNALKTQSEIFDKIMDRGVKVGVIQDKKVEEVEAKDPDKLIEQLLKERQTMTLIIEELQVTRERHRRFLLKQGGPAKGGTDGAILGNFEEPIQRAPKLTEGSSGDNGQGSGNPGLGAVDPKEEQGFSTAMKKPKTSKVIKPKPRERVTFGELAAQMGQHDFKEE